MPANPFYRPPVRDAKPPVNLDRSRLQILESGFFEFESILAKIAGELAASAGSKSNSATRNLDRVKKLLAFHLRGEKPSTATKD